MYVKCCSIDQWHYVGWFIAGLPQFLSTKVPRSFIACVPPIEAFPSVWSYHFPGRSAPTLPKITNVSGLMVNVYFQWFHWSYKPLLLFRFLLSNRKVSVDQKYQEILLLTTVIKELLKGVRLTTVLDVTSTT